MALTLMDRNRVVLKSLVELSETRYARIGGTDLARATGLPVEEVDDAIAQLREHGHVRASVVEPGPGEPSAVRAARLTVTGRREAAM